MNIFRNLRYLNKGLAILLLLLVATTAIASIYLSRTIFNTRALLDHGSSAVAATLLVQGLEVNLQTATSAERGYIISGDPAYLRVYENTVKQIPATQDQLNDAQLGLNKQEIKALNNLVSKRLEDMRGNIEARQKQGLNAAAANFAAKQEMQTMISIDQLIKKIAGEQITPIGSTLNQTRHSLDIAIGVAIAIIVIVAILSLLIIWYWQKAVARERATETVKNEFLSLASHQLRTPATNIKQHLGLLLEGYLGKLTPRQINALKVANQNNETEIHIINDLLDVAKLDLNKIHLHKKPTNMYQLAKEVVDAYRPTLQKRRQTVKFDKPDKQLEATVDPSYMKGVIENLLDNASKYSRPKTRILVRLKRVKNRVCLSVVDQGVGVNKRDMPKLFKKFSRIPNDLSENVETTGLGLYWVRQVISLHGGRVSVKSWPGRGSAFSIELPAIRENNDF